MTDVQEDIASGKALEMLMSAVRARDDLAAFEACKTGVDVLPRCDAHGNTPLLTAAARGSLVAVDAILSAGADPLCCNKVGMNALMAACRRYEPVYGLPS